MARLRLLVVSLLALQLAASVRSSEALILCIATDGGATLEFAAAGTGRCGDCAPTDVAGGACRDVVVLAGVADLAPGTATNVPAQLAALAVAPQTSIPALRGRSPAEAGTLPACSDAAQRCGCVVLTI